MTRVFVIGLDPFNLATARDLRESGRYVFCSLLPVERVRHAPSYDYDALLVEADERLRRASRPIDAIVTWWDFPSTAMVPVLTELWDLPGPDLRSVATLEHKYWSRLLQQMVVPDHVPHFAPVDPFADDAQSAVLDAGIAFPFWLKPVKSVASYLGFRVESPHDFDRAVAAIRAGIGHFADPFHQALCRVRDVPDEVARAGSRSCLAEGITAGHQCTLEGYVSSGRVHVYGAVDSVRHDGTSTFTEYRYPSRLPPAVLRQMEEIAIKVVVAAGLDHSCFNVEFFHDEAQGRVWLLEINARLSQSHCDLFAKVDGVSSQRVLLDVARGASPRMPHRSGDHAVACKYFLRATHDGIVCRAPSEQEVQAVERRFSGTRIDLAARSGTRLARLPVQEPYSYELGRVFIGAEDHDELDARVKQIADLLRFEIEPIRGPS